MTGRNSPWGGGGNDGGGSGDGDGSDGADASGSQPDEPQSETPERKGPRNPWLPSGEGTPPRRSASIEDIFRRGDQRRPGGGGGGPRGPGGFPNLPRRPDGKSWLPLGIGAAVLVVLGFSSVHMLGPKEQGVVTTLGQYSRTVDSGVSLTLPWPIEQVKVVDVSSFQVVAVPDNENEKLMLTSDKSLVDLSYLVRWNIKGLKDYTFRLADPDGTVQEVAEAAMRASIAQVSLGQALSGAGRAQVEQDVGERMQRILDFYRSGIAIQGVEIKKADPPAKTKGAFDNVNVAQQEAERDRSEARAWAQQVIARAQGDASSFDKVYEEYRLAPEVTKRRMYYETMERVLRDNDTVVGEKGVNTVLPLPEMQRRAAPAPDTSVSVPTSTGGQ
ncbi:MULTISPECIES: protease modulator HflK [Novosphingobium]|jgi:membrane protease subunit HflK|uniref:HflK protein n=1 Tax=Novosphingobium resinovorum TaxID=158500 RepID=A0A031JXB6_9SPHN|nr:protease modulator HflK [Novosphingobium resinovorum]EZP81433.1 HflK protein [Novosphingobium resinovorum]GLK46596.1 protease modulator HflK [Novosphingobium resinovorum]